MKSLIIQLESFKLKYPKAFFIGVWGVLFCICILVRLPHFLSRNFFFDGDEAIVGIMGQDWAKLRAFPTYFYGQNYGFCVFEVLSVALWIKILGTGIWALRLGGLLLFSLGISLVVLGMLKRAYSKKAIVLFALIFCTFPVWYLWGAMVRGGYVQAFAAVAGIFYLFSFTTWHWGRAVGIALLAAIAFESHVLILLPLLPLFLNDWFQHKYSWQKLVLVCLGFGALAILLKLTDGYYNGWNSPPLMIDRGTFINAVYCNFMYLPEVFGGFYFYNAFLDVPFWWFIGLCLLIGLYFFLVLLSAKNQKIGILILWLVTLLFGVGVIGMFGVYSPRYMLGCFTSILFFCLYFFPKTRLAYTLLCIIFVIQLFGTMAGSKLKREWYPNGANQLSELELIHQEVVKKKKKAVMVTDNLGQWQWNYLYGDSIPATAFRRVERLMRYSEKTYHYYDQHNDEVAIIGLWGVFWSMDSIPGFNNYRYQVGEKYYYMDKDIEQYIEKGESVAR